MSGYLAPTLQHFAFASKSQGQESVAMSKWMALTLGLLLASTQSQAADIWLSGIDPYMRQIVDPGTNSDFMELFRSDAPWSDVERKIHVLKISTPFVLRGDENQLRETFAGIHRLGIQLA